MTEPSLTPKQADTAQAESTLRSAGQRHVNILWEVTQAIIAVVVTIGTPFIAGTLVLRSDNNSAATAFLLLSNAFFMIVTSYFQRTNHTRMGGVPPEQKIPTERRGE